MHQGSLNGVSRKLQECFKKVSRVFQGRLKSVLREFSLGFKCFCKKLKGDFREVSKVFQGSFKCVQRKFLRMGQGSSKSVFGCAEQLKN